ncbi:MAG TPA: glycosyltransferase family 1 protein, partial [Saprospiraceae bacterium]|nr:glycosyltransferase family 1 protein [Saprospiraceae bacterium]
DQFYFFFDRSFDPVYIYGDNVFPVVLPPQSRHPVLWYWWFEKSLPGALKKYQIDVFFSPEMYVSLSTHLPTLMYIHDVAFLHYSDHIGSTARKFLQYFIPRYLEKARKIGSVSQTTKKDIMRFYDVSEKKIFVAGNGPTPGFSKIPDYKVVEVKQLISKGKPFFIYVGAMHPRKNISGIIKAYNRYRELCNHEYRVLVLAGRLAWKYRHILHEHKKSPFKDDIIFTGHVTDPSTLMGAADALLYPSLAEGFGIPILEAMSCEVPVITSSLSAMPEIAGDAALLVDPHHIESIANAMLTITNDERLRNDLIEKGKKRVLSFSWENTSQKIYNELVQLCQGVGESY